jgi:hypothetical protein
MKQEVNRRHAADKWALDDVVMTSEVTHPPKEYETLKDSPSEGVYVYGLHLDGCAWCAMGGCGFVWVCCMGPRESGKEGGVRRRACPNKASMMLPDVWWCPQGCYMLPRHPHTQPPRLAPLPRATPIPPPFALQERAREPPGGL